MSGTETVVATKVVAVLETEEARTLLEAGREAGSLNEAKKQLRLARDLGPGTPLGTEARRFLERLP